MQPLAKALTYYGIATWKTKRLQRRTLHHLLALVGVPCLLLQLIIIRSYSHSHNNGMGPTHNSPGNVVVGISFHTFIETEFLLRTTISIDCLLLLNC